MLNLVRNAVMAVFLIFSGAIFPIVNYFPGNYIGVAEAAVRDLRCSRTPLRVRLVLDLDDPAVFDYVYDNNELKLRLSTDILEERTLDISKAPLQKHKEFAKYQKEKDKSEEKKYGKIQSENIQNKTAQNEKAQAKEQQQADKKSKKEVAVAVKQAVVRDGEKTSTKADAEKISTKTKADAANVSAEKMELPDFDPRQPFVEKAVLKRRGNGTSLLLISLLEKTSFKVMNFHEPERIVIDINRVIENAGESAETSADESAEISADESAKVNCDKSAQVNHDENAKVNADKSLQVNSKVNPDLLLRKGNISAGTAVRPSENKKVLAKSAAVANKALGKNSAKDSAKEVILPSRKEKKLAKGLTYTFCQKVEKYGPVRLHMITLAPESSFELRPFSAAVDRQGRGKLLQAAETLQAVAAVNGGYFDTDTDGWIIGNLRWQGMFMGGDATPRSAFIIDKKGKANVIRDVSFSGRMVFSNGGSLPLTGINRKRLAEDLLLYTGSYGMSTGTNEYGFEIMLKKGRVVDMSGAGNMPLIEGTEVLSGHGVMAAALESLRIGEKVKLQLSFGSKKADEAKLLLSGGPSLIEKGKINVRSEEESIARDIARGRAPRTAIGVKADGSVILMVIDGRSKYSKGVSLYELAAFLLEEGAVEAVNLDGGGSSEMVVDGKIVNRPSDGVERRISTALGVFPR